MVLYLCSAAPSGLNLVFKNSPWVSPMAIIVLPFQGNLRSGFILIPGGYQDSEKKLARYFDNWKLNRTI